MHKTTLALTILVLVYASARSLNSHYFDSHPVLLNVTAHTRWLNASSPTTKVLVLIKLQTLNATDKWKEPRFVTEEKLQEPIPSPLEEVREPLDLIVVLDNSGSMNGKRMESAKQAVIDVIKSLQEHDTISLVKYSDYGTIVFQNATKADADALVHSVSRIRAQGSTNLYNGIEQGISIAKLLPKNRMRSMFIYSDGHANVGKFSHSEIFSIVSDVHEMHDMPVWSFGVGYGYDNEMMEGIAAAGHGQFLFIDTPESIVHVTRIATRSARSAFGKNSTIVLGAAPGVNIAKVYAELDKEGNIIVGDLRYNDTRSFVAELEVTKPEHVEEGQVHPVLNYGLIFHNATTNERHAKAGEIKLTYTSDQSKLKRGRSRVKNFYRLQQINEKQQDVIKHLKADKFEEAQRELYLIQDEYESVEESDDEDNDEILRVMKRRVSDSVNKMKTSTSTADILKHQSQSYKMNRESSKAHDEL